MSEACSLKHLGQLRAIPLKLRSRQEKASLETTWCYPGLSPFRSTLGAGPTRPWVDLVLPYFQSPLGQFQELGPGWLQVRGLCCMKSSFPLYVFFWGSMCFYFLLILLMENVRLGLACNFVTKFWDMLNCKYYMNNYCIEVYYSKLTCAFLHQTRLDISGTGLGCELVLAWFQIF